MKLITVFLIIATSHLPLVLGLKCLVCEYTASDVCSVSTKDPHPCRDGHLSGHSEDCLSGNACVSKIVRFDKTDHVKSVKRYCDNHIFGTYKTIRPQPSGPDLVETISHTHECTKYEKNEALECFCNDVDNCNSESGPKEPNLDLEIPTTTTAAPIECPCPSIYAHPPAYFVFLLSVMGLCVIVHVVAPFVHKPHHHPH